MKHANGSSGEKQEVQGYHGQLDARDKMALERKNKEFHSYNLIATRYRNKKWLEPHIFDHQVLLPQAMGPNGQAHDLSYQ